MASIRHVSTGRVRVLEPEHLVGRAVQAPLRIQDAYISMQHAVLRWNGEGWELKDLGSRNGTFLDGRAVSPTREYPIRAGSRLAFGKPDDEWEIVEVSPPQPMAVPLDGGEPLLLERDLLALPSGEDARATIFRASDGTWLLEHAPQVTAPLTNLQTFEVAGKTYRFCCTETVLRTALSPQSGSEIASVHLTFSVSRDEEHVNLQVTYGGATFDLGSRSHNYLLLTLARRRLSDAEEGLPETSCGWIYQDDLASDPSMSPPQLNNDVFRVRKQFAALRLLDAANIIERRPRTRQLRIGTRFLSIIEI